MKKLYYLLLLSIITIPLNSQQWELIEGRSFFYNPIIEGDTLIGINEGEWLVSYKNKSWDSINYNRKLLESIDDTILYKNVLASEPYLNEIYRDNNKDYWSILHYNAIFAGKDIVLHDDYNKIRYYNYYKPLDSINLTQIYSVFHANFDKNNCPYFIISNVNERVDYVSVCKMVNNQIIEINKHSYNSYSTTSIRICFDNKNGFWVNVNDSLFYYENDKVSKSFKLADFPKSEYVQGGYFTKVVTDQSNRAIVSTSLFGIYTYENNIWTLDSTFATYLFASSLYSNDKNFTNIEIDENDNLWVYYCVSPFIHKRDKYNNWSCFRIPSCTPNEYYGSGTGATGVAYETFQVDSNNRIWLFTIFNGKYFIFTPPNN